MRAAFVAMILSLTTSAMAQQPVGYVLVPQPAAPVLMATPQPLVAPMAWQAGYPVAYSQYTLAVPVPSWNVTSVYAPAYGQGLFFYRARFRSRLRW